MQPHQHPDYPWTPSGTQAVSGALPRCWLAVGTPGQGHPQHCASPPAHLDPVLQDTVHPFPAPRTGVSPTWDFRTLFAPSGHMPRPGASGPSAHPDPALHACWSPNAKTWRFRNPCAPGGHDPRLGASGTPLASALFLHWHPVGLVTTCLVTMPDPHMGQAPQGPCAPRPSAPGCCTQTR